MDRARRILSVEPDPADYEVVPDQVQALIDEDLAFLREEYGIEPSAKAIASQTRLRLLSALYAGQQIAFTEHDRGVIVLAVGPESVGSLLKHLAVDEARKVVVSWPQACE